MTVGQRVTYAEYLAAEERSTEKHDYIDGEVVAASGGTLEHSVLCASIASLIKNALPGHDQFVFGSTARVRRVETAFTCYPDASVVIGKVESADDDKQGILNPLLIIEVLRRSTEARDRGLRARQYRGIPSLKEFVFLSQDRRLVEVFRRNAAGRFELFEWTEGEFELASLDVRISIPALYANAETIRAQRS